VDHLGVLCAKQLKNSEAALNLNVNTSLGITIMFLNRKIDEVVSTNLI